MSRIAAALIALACATGAARADAPPAATGADECRADELAALGAALRRVEAELAALQATSGMHGAQEVAPPPDADRLRVLEERVARLQEELRRLTEASEETANALDAVSSEDQQRIGLTIYGTVDAAAYEGERTVLDGRLFELVLSGRPHKRLSFVAQVEFEHAAEVGGERGGEVVVEQAYATLGIHPALNFRAGVFLIPFGNVGIDHFPPRREVVSPPLASTVVAPGDWTDNGFGFSGQQPLGREWLLGYEVYLAAGLDARIDALGLRRARQGFGVDNNGDKALAGRVSLGRGQRLALGLSGYRGKYDDAGRRVLGAWALDGLALVGPFKLTGEIESFSADRGPAPPARYRGGYARVVYEFAGRWLARNVLGRDFEEPRLALVLQYDEASLHGPQGEGLSHNRQRRFTAGLDFHPAREWILKLNREWNSVEGAPLANGGRDGWLASVGFIF